MANNQILVSGTVVDSLGSHNISPLLITGAVQPGPTTQTLVTLVSGNNVVTVPATARGVILLPLAVASPFRFTGATVADAGVPISPTQPTVLSFDPANVPASLNLVASSSAGTVTATFF